MVEKHTPDDLAKHSHYYFILGLRFAMEYPLAALDTLTAYKRLRPAESKSLGTVCNEIRTNLTLGDSP